MPRARAALDPHPHPDAGLRLRALRLDTGLDEAAFAEALGLELARYQACERGAAPLPAGALPALARLADAPLASVLAEFYGAREHAAELHALAAAFDSIPSPVRREALLHMALALAYGAEGWAGG